MTIDKRPRGPATAALIIAVFIFVVAVVRLWEKRRPLPDPIEPPAFVEIRGDVPRPGVHLIEKPQPTVRDALLASGGDPSRMIDGQADLLSSPVGSGDSLDVRLEPGGNLMIEVGRVEGAARLTLGFRLDVNNAAQEELTLVPGMKAEQAQAIVSRRAALPWSSVDELVEISGVGPRTAEKWKEYLEVNPPEPRRNP